ncbi:MAG: GAF domain-containing protein, partial [Anaerolineales bacterium]|nr:GAF domain-containing protein [Anaerolineales bacterium]
GVLDIQSLQPGVFSEDDERIMLTFAGRSALALENARLASETQRRLERLSALRSIDQAIAGTVDLKITLKVLNQEAIQQLGIDAVDILLYDPHLQTLEFAAGSGFHTPALQHTSLRLGEGFAGQAALERRIIHIDDIRAMKNGLKKAPLLGDEGFVTYYGVPLIAKGKVKGVMELFHRAPLAPILFR